jgi:murein L,D-transpeptidase YafK
MFHKIINTCLLVCAGLLFSFQEPSFKAAQLKNSRVKAAYEKKWSSLKLLLTTNEIQTGNFDLYLRAFKNEAVVEAWVKNKEKNAYTLLRSFSICASSGKLGPKRKQGDNQVPEGFYEITAFQPQSSYHLALKVGYPNKSDRLKAPNGDPGGDIMIHGNCVTIGCIPIENEPIEELYVLCVEAKNRNAVIRTDIYPFKFGSKTEGLMRAQTDREILNLWSSLKTAYDCFEKNQRLPQILTDKKGNYIINPAHS